MERSLGGGLDGRSIRHRIAERHPDFNDVGAGIRQSPNDFPARLQIRITGGDKGDEACPPLSLQSGEAGIHPAASSCGSGTHSETPKRSATAKTSLSPLPQRFITSR